MRINVQTETEVAALAMVYPADCRSEVLAQTAQNMKSDVGKHHAAGGAASPF